MGFLESCLSERGTRVAGHKRKGGRAVHIRCILCFMLALVFGELRAIGGPGTRKATSRDGMYGTRSWVYKIILCIYLEKSLTR